METAKVLLYDIETSPHIGYTWNKWETDVIEFIKEKQIISFAWKWLGEKEVHVLSLPMFKTYRKNRDDNRELVTALHKLISEADITCGHNVASFDDKVSNAEFVLHGLTPPPPHKQIDTLRIAKRHFKFSSNKLGDLAVRLGLGSKVPHSGFALWRGCLDGDPKSWRLMEKYNKGDVVLLEKVYFKLRPWMEGHPALKPREDSNKNPPCPICHERKLHSRGFSVSRKGKTPRVQCQACGHWPPVAWIRKAWRIK